MERPGFAFIIDIELEKLPPFFSACKMIGDDISICKRHPDNLNNTVKPSAILSKHVANYKPPIVQTKETNDAPHKELVGVTKKQKSAVEEHIYDVPVRNTWVVEVEGVSIDLDILVEVVAGQVENGS